MRTGITVFFWKVAAASSLMMSSVLRRILREQQHEDRRIHQRLRRLGPPVLARVQQRVVPASTPRSVSRPCSSPAFAWSDAPVADEDLARHGGVRPRIPCSSPSNAACPG